MKLILKGALIFGYMVSTVWPAETPPAPAKGHIVTTTLHSVVLGRDVALHVWLPPGYDAPANAQTKYPVMYLFDGKDVFDAVGDGKEKVHLDVALDRMVGDGTLRPVVVVAMEQLLDYVARAREYAVYRDVFNAPDGPEPHGQRLPDFIRGEVMPKIAAAFRVSAESTQTGIGGYSYGGAAALYLLMRCPMTFGLGSLESPSLQLGNGQLLRDTVYLASGGNRVAIGVGTKELGEDEDTVSFGRTKREYNRGWVRSCETLAANLRAAFVPPEVRLEIEDNAGHNTASWGRRLPGDLVFLFGAKP